MSTNVFISTARANGSCVDHLQAEPLIMVPNPIVDSYIDYTDAFSMYKRKGLGYGIEPEGCPRVGEHIQLRWQDDNKCCLYGIV